MKLAVNNIIALAAMTLAAKGAVITGSVSTFAGPDDLLLDPSTNIVAVDLNGRNGTLAINGVNFQSDGVGGTGGSVTGGGATVTTSAANEIASWQTAPTYTGSDAASVSNLQSVMHSIRWNAAPNTVNVDISGLTGGTSYNVQLLFSENGSGADRHWDIAVDGILAVDDYSTNGTSASLGSVYSGNFDPGSDGILNIVMGQEPFPNDPNNTGPLGADNNPILHGVIVHTAIPEPGSLALLGLGLSGLFMRRRRK